MESCSKENIFRRYYSPEFVFTKPEYLTSEAFENFELRNKIKNVQLLYSKIPKKENHQPNMKGNQSNLENSKRGSYNFINKLNPGTSNSFITRDDMLVPEKTLKVQEKRRRKLEENKISWTLPK